MYPWRTNRMGGDTFRYHTFEGDMRRAEPHPYKAFEQEEQGKQAEAESTGCLPCIGSRSRLALKRRKKHKVGRVWVFGLSALLARWTVKPVPGGFSVKRVSDVDGWVEYGDMRRAGPHPLQYFRAGRAGIGETGWDQDLVPVKCGHRV